MLGANHQSVGWPACGEVDIMEHWGHQPTVISGAIHTPDSFGDTWTMGETIISDYSTQFHIYSINWTSEKIEFLEHIDKSVMVLKEVMNPDGFNIGANLGEAAGAGIKDHIHFHVVPRWAGDTNFMPVLGHTKVQVQGLRDCYDSLKPHFDRINITN